MIPAMPADAITDYRMLLDKGYPERGSVALVGDRFRLTRDQRHMLFRGVSPTIMSNVRRSRVIAQHSLVWDDVLGVDAHNVLLTLANYIRGVAVFETDDGVLRDIGGVHGRLHDEALMARSIDLLAERLQTISVARIVVCFDEPLSHSRRHMARLSAAVTSPDGQETGEPGVPREEARRHDRTIWSFLIGPSADELIVNSEPTVIATSDSALMDRTSGRVCDIARWILESVFSPVFEPLPR